MIGNCFVSRQGIFISITFLPLSTNLDTQLSCHKIASLLCNIFTHMENKVIWYFHLFTHLKFVKMYDKKPKLGKNNPKINYYSYFIILNPLIKHLPVCLIFLIFQNSMKPHAYFPLFYWYFFSEQLLAIFNFKIVDWILLHSGFFVFLVDLDCLIALCSDKPHLWLIEFHVEDCILCCDRSWLRFLLDDLEIMTRPPIPEFQGT